MHRLVSLLILALIVVTISCDSRPELPVIGERQERIFMNQREAVKLQLEPLEKEENEYRRLVRLEKGLEFEKGVLKVWLGISEGAPHYFVYRRDGGELHTCRISLVESFNGKYPMHRDGDVAVHISEKGFSWYDDFFTRLLGPKAVEKFKRDQKLLTEKEE